MKKIALFMLSSGLLACGVEDAQTQERALAEATTVAIKFDIRPGVVAYRDGVDAPWQYAQRTSAVDYQATVHGPYTLAYGCSDDGATNVTQIAQVPADGTQLFGYCDTILFPSQDFRQVSGRVAQPGRVLFGYNDIEITAPNETFSTIDYDGTYDLLSITETDIALRRGVVIHGDTVIAPVIDTAAQGGPLRHASFSASNVQPGETTVAVAWLDTASLQFFLLHNGALDDVALAPDAVLAAGDAQTVSVRARIGAATRAQRMPAREGNPTAAVLPDAIGGPAWTENSSTLAFDWTSRPAGYRLYAGVYGTSTNGTDFVQLNFEATDAYLTASGTTHVDIKSDLPGFKPAWNIDLASGYSHNATFQLVAPDDVVSSSWVSGDFYDVGAHAAPVRARTAKPRYARP